MRRWTLFLLCLVLGTLAVTLGYLIPAHLRAVDARVLERAGRDTPSLVDRGVAMVNEKNLGAAELLLAAAQENKIPDSQRLAQAITNLAAQSPSKTYGKEPLTEFLLRTDNRARALEAFERSPRLFLKELLRCRELKSTVLFSPSQSASGQAFDAALCVCGLLSEEGHLTPDLTYSISSLAVEAVRSGKSEQLEEVLLDFLSLGQRLTWKQMVSLIGPIENTPTLHVLAGQMRQGKVSTLFAATQLSGRPTAVADYLVKFSRTGTRDLADSLRFGEGGIRELLDRNLRLYTPPHDLKWAFLLDWSWQKPKWAKISKWGLYLLGGFLWAAGLHFARPKASLLERPLQVRGFHLARESLFALGFLLVVLLLSEPFLSEENQAAAPRFRLQLPSVGNAAPAAKASAAQSSNMNQLLITMALFFVLQALLYIACLVKLAEIRRQRVAVRLKLKLLENEEHLFDAGLYLGFAGTIISLILVSMGIFKLSLMAAYSSTSFGIIFVSVFKIFHLRPLRRKMLLEQDSAPSEPLPYGGKTTTNPS